MEYADRAELFEGLSIYKEETYRKLQGTYPVIFLSFAEIKEQDYPSAKMKIYQLLTDLYIKHDYLLEDDWMADGDRKYFLSVGMDMPEYVATRALHKLSAFLNRHYEKKTIVCLWSCRENM